MARIYAGRYTAVATEPMIVFAIGMRLNRLWAIHRWWRPMWDTLGLVWHLWRNPPEGYLHGKLFLYWRGVGMLQYWKGFDELEVFSRDGEQPHVEAWRKLATLTKTDQTFGYWHETYRVAPGSFECIYGSMPRFGMAEAAEHVPVSKASEAARGRIDQAMAGE